MSIQRSALKERARLIEDIEEMRAVSLNERAGGNVVVLVPTMGGLHRGHEELIRQARELGDTVIVSIFVNPKQFGPGEDISAYPRDLDGDLLKSTGAGADIVFHPDSEALYPDGFQTYVEVGEDLPLSSNLCGKARPGHFKGVATIVTKLFNICLPNKAVFGLKDYQQFTILERLVADLDLGVEMFGVETVREADGLALSSRNAYLSPREREAAGVIPAALKAAEELVAAGCKKSSEIIEEVKKKIENEEQAVIDYIAVSDLKTLENIENIDSKALLALAVRIGCARLIDNVVLGKEGL
jgi:pantoate--beta-alanine ligase